MTYDDAMVAVSEGKLVTHPGLPGGFVVMGVSKSGIISGMPLVIYKNGMLAGEYRTTEEDMAVEDWAVIEVAQD